MGRIIFWLNILTLFFPLTYIFPQSKEYCASIENFTRFGLYTIVSDKFYEKDLLKTSAGDLEITFIGHSTLMFKFGDKVVYNDPVRMYADFFLMPKADMILVAHDHADHFDPKAIGFIRTDKTSLVLTQTCSIKIQGGLVMSNGDVQNVQGIQI